MEVVLRSAPLEVDARLQELGLEHERLRDVVRQGYLAYAECTDNHPPLVPPIMAWGETVRSLREYLLPVGWTRSDFNNYSLTVDSSERMAIAVATGNAGTGLADQLPSTKSPKGPSTSAAVCLNQLELNLQFESNTSQVDSRLVTWFLLVYRGTDELRCELSLPSSMTRDGYIDGWRERILLGAIPLDWDEMETIEPPQLPDITVNVRRRA